MKAGDLVRYKGSRGLGTPAGIVMGAARKRWSKPADVWVLWNGKRKATIESGGLLEVISESR